MSDKDPIRPTEHEERMTGETADQSGEPLTPEPGGATDRFTGDPDAPAYEAEVEAQRRGTTADEIEEDAAEDEPTPLDAAYKPRSG